MKQFWQMTVEATIAGTVAAVAWRMYHNSHKAQVERYYVNLKKEMAGDEE